MVIKPGLHEFLNCWGNMDLMGSERVSASYRSYHIYEVIWTSNIYVLNEIICKE